MATEAIYTKSLGGAEDLLLDASNSPTVIQTRAGKELEITKINSSTIPYSGKFGDPAMVSIKDQLDTKMVSIKDQLDTKANIVSSAYTVETIEELINVPVGFNTVIVKDINSGGTFVSKTEADEDPNTGSVYTVNGGTVFAKLGGGFWVRQYSGAINVKWFGTVGDGVADDTAAIQAAIDRMPAGSVLSGNGLTFVVRKLNVPSNIIMRDFNLITKPGAVIGEFWSPITVGNYGDTTLHENITLINIHVNGNRSLNETGTTGGEDGGKHGFRFIGRIHNLRVIECSANYCSSYGFLNFVGEFSGADGTDTPLQSDIKFIGCVARYNKAHGAAADSVDGLSYIGCSFNENGKDIPGSPGGKISGGLYYGNGIDLEGYGLDSRLTNVTIRDCDLSGNKSASLFIADPVDQQNPEFKVRSGFFIHNNRMTAGEADSNANNIALSITPPYASWQRGVIYENIEITGGEIYGNINIYTSRNVFIDVPKQTKIGAYMGDAAYSIILVRNRPGYLFQIGAGPRPTYQYYHESTVDGLGRRDWFREDMTGFIRQGVHSERIAFAANEEKTVIIPLYRNLADKPWSVLPCVNYVSIGGQISTPAAISSTQTSVTVVLRNGAVAQTLSIYCEVLGL